MNIPSRPALLVTLLLLALQSSACGSRSGPVEPPAQPTSYRLVDHTDDQAVVESPMVDLASRLERVQERWSSADLEPLTSARGLTCWRNQPSSRPVLLAEEDLVARVGGRPVEPGTIQYVEPVWTFATRAAEGEADTSGFRELVEHGVVTWDLDLPSGGLHLALSVTNEDRRRHHYWLEVLLDDRVIGEVRGSEDQELSLETTVEGGAHRLGLRTPARAPEGSAYVPRLRIEAQARAGWFTLCADAAPSSVEVSYPADPADRGLAALAALRPLDRLLDRGVGADPHGMKKKLDLGVVARTVLLAPTPSELRYEVDVPADGRLRIGYGHAADSGQAAAGARFEVLLEGEHGTAELLAQQLPPDGMNLVERTLDLSAYGGQRCVLRLRTLDGGRGADEARHLPTVWYDPVLYAAPSTDDQPRPVNVILVSLDTLRADRLGCYGHHADTSPQLDALAADAVLFERAYAQYPTTAISHVSFLTSRYPHRSARALLAEYGAAREEDVQGETTLAEHLRQGGWFTGAITGGGVLHPMFGFSAGFDFYEARDVDDSPEVLLERTAAWLEGNADKPFFLFLHTYQIHSPYAPPEPHRSALWAGEETSLDPVPMLRSRGQGLCHPLGDREREAMLGLYDGEIRFTDEALIGPLVALLRELELYDDTLLIVTSDHGEEFGEHGCWTHGSTVHEQAMHVPLLIKFPHGRYAGRRVQDVVPLVDLMPTVLDVAGVEYDAHALDGVELVSVLDGERRDGGGEAFGLKLATEPRDGSTHVVIADLFVARGDDKLIVVERLPDDAPPGAGVALYDLVADPGEQQNRAGERPQLRDELLERVRAYYDPGVSLGEEGITEFGHGGDAWKRHLQELGYLE